MTIDEIRERHEVKSKYVSRYDEDFCAIGFLLSRVEEAKDELTSICPDKDGYELSEAIAEHRKWAEAGDEALRLALAESSHLRAALEGAEKVIDEGRGLAEWPRCNSDGTLHPSCPLCRYVKALADYDASRPARQDTKEGA